MACLGGGKKVVTKGRKNKMQARKEKVMRARLGNGGNETGQLV